MAEKFEIDIEVKAGGLKSLKDYREELKAINLAMQQAAAIGDKGTFDRLSRQYGELKNDARDFGDAMKYSDPGEFLNGVTKLAQGMAGAFSGVSAGVKLIAGDNEQLNAALGKTATVIQLIQGLEQARALTESKGVIAGMKNQLASLFLKQKDIAITTAQTVATGKLTIAQKALNLVMKLNPIGLIIAGVTALVTAVVLLSDKFDENAFITEQWSKRARKNINDLKDSTKAYVDLINGFNKSVSDFNDRNLSSSEKAKKNLDEVGYKQKKNIEELLAGLKLQEEAARKQLENDKAALDYLVATPEAYMRQLKVIEKAEERYKGLNTQVEELTKKYSKFKESLEVTAAKTIETIEAQRKLAEEEEKAEKNKQKYIDDTAKLRTDIHKGEIEAIEEKEVKLKAVADDEITAVNQLIASSELKAERIKQIEEKLAKDIFDIKAEALSDEMEYEREKEIEQFEWMKTFAAKEQERKELMREIEIELMQDQFAQEEARLYDEMNAKLAVVEYGSEEEAKINELWAQRLNEIDKNRTEYVKKLDEDRIASTYTTLSAVADIYSNFGKILGEETREGAIFARAAALFQIGVDTAKAISSATAASSANPTNAVTFGAAGIAQFAVMMAQIIGNIAQAKQLLSQPLPKYATGGMYFGPGSGTSDSINAKLSNGEGVLTARSMAIPAFRSIASAINVAGGGIPFTGTSNNASIIDYDLLAQKINDKKVIVVESEITDSQKKVKVLTNRTILG